MTELSGVIAVVFSLYVALMLAIGYATSRDPRYAGTHIRTAFDTYAEPPEFELYDLANDPWEFHNLAGSHEHAEAEQRLKTALEAWRHETDDPTLDPAFHDQIKQQFADD